MFIIIMLVMICLVLLFGLGVWFSDVCNVNLVIWSWLMILVVDRLWEKFCLFVE